MRRSLGTLAMIPLLVAGCALTRGGTGGPPDPARWPFTGLTEVQGFLLGAYQDRLFSGSGIEFEPGDVRLFAEAGHAGALSIIHASQGKVTSVIELGQGSLLENFVFHPDGGHLYVVGSTVSPDNLGRVQLARALLKIDSAMLLLQTPIALRPGGYCHGLAIQPRRSLLFCLDSAGAAMTGGAALTRIDLLTNEPGPRRPVGSLPAGVRRRGLALDDRQDLVFALLAAGDGGSDFDPPASPAGRPACFLAAIDPDSLGIVERVPLPADLDYSAVLPTPRGVMVVGTSPRGTSLIEIDTRLMKQAGWVDLPEPASDAAVAGRASASAGRIAVLPAPHGLYVIDLDSFSLRGVFPYDLFRPGDVALSADGRTAGVLVEERETPGRLELGLVDMGTGRLLEVVR